MGPFGSGKTAGCLIDIIYRARAQAPNPIDKVRRSRFAVVRKTYRDLERTVLASWDYWIGRDAGDFTGGGGGQPAVHMLRFKLPDGTTVETEVMFVAIGDNAIEDVARGWELTGVYLNEVDLLEIHVVLYLLGRIGRYPAVDRTIGFTGATWSGVWMDFNAPDTEHWLYKALVEGMIDGKAIIGWEFFRQPGGLEAGAENLLNLRPGYYQDMVNDNPDWYVRRFVHNRFGYSRLGLPVHPEFNDTLHVANHELRPIDRLGLVIGIDPRTIPSAVFMQRPASGQRLFMDELQGEQNMGAHRFGRLLAQKLHDSFPGHRPNEIKGIVDPSARYGADRENDEQDWCQIVESESGVRIEPAPTNNLDMRRAALKKPLMQLIDGGPAILLSSRCKILRAGLNAGFRFRKINTSGIARYAPDVEKNEWADMCEAAEYACLADGAEIEIREREKASRNQTRQQTAIDDPREERGYAR